MWQLFIFNYPGSYPQYNIDQKVDAISSTTYIIFIVPVKLIVSDFDSLNHRLWLATHTKVDLTDHGQPELCNWLLNPKQTQWPIGI